MLRVLQMSKWADVCQHWEFKKQSVWKNNGFIARKSSPSSWLETIFPKGLQAAVCPGRSLLVGQKTKAERCTKASRSHHFKIEDWNKATRRGRNHHVRGCISYRGGRGRAAGLGAHSFREGLKAQPFPRVREASGTRASAYQVGFLFRRQNAATWESPLISAQCNVESKNFFLHARMHIHSTATQ